MITIGVDVHKRTHTFVAVDQVGAMLGQKTVRAITTGHREAITWARSLADGKSVRWAIEDCRNMSSHLERDLLAAGEQAVRVTPHLMADTRRAGRERGKSDPIDALAVARAALREPDLPVAGHDKASREARLLTDHRDDLVVRRTAVTNRLRWNLHEIDPQRADQIGSLTTIKHQNGARTLLESITDGGVLVEIALDELKEIVSLTEKIKAVDKTIAAVTGEATVELRKLDGCGVLTAAKILGETANIDRFATVDKYARYAGIAPVPVWSGNTAGRVRLTRSGNRQLNRAVHTIALTQTRLKGSKGRAYYEKKLAEGKSRKEALRCLKRRLLRTIYNALNQDHQNCHNQQLPSAA